MSVGSNSTFFHDTLVPTIDEEAASARWSREKRSLIHKSGSRLLDWRS
jgi:hypothetical protein